MSQASDLIILEAASEPAVAWRSRWDSLKPLIAVRYGSLPGECLPATPPLPVAVRGWRAFCLPDRRGGIRGVSCGFTARFGLHKCRSSNDSWSAPANAF